MKYLVKLSFVLLLTAGVSGCSDFLNPSTPQSKRVNSIDGVSDLKGLLIGGYSRLAQTNLYGRDYIIYGDVRTDNAFSSGSSGRFDQLSLFQYTVGSDYADGTWTAAYEVIINANLVINNDVLEEDTAQLKLIKGQAYALRALTHMMLLHLYGQQNVEGSNLGIPYITETAYAKEERFFPDRLSVEAARKAITDDFKKALELLKTDTDPNTPIPNLSPTQLDYFAVLGLLSRHYLHTENYAGASTAAKR